MVSLLQYLSGDYAHAVQGGTVLDATEYQEMIDFTVEAQRLHRSTGQADASISADLDRLAGLVGAKASPDEVRAVATGAARRAIEVFGIQTIPAQAPDLDNGLRVWMGNCTACHGATGAADTAVAATLKPPPISLHDPQRADILNPFRIYNAVALGIEGTAMQSFRNLSDGDRWDVAFFALGLRYAGKANDGQPLLDAQPSLAGMFDLKSLATSSDEEFVVRFEQAGLPRESYPALLAYARTEAPRKIVPAAEGPGPIAFAKAQLDRVTQAYGSGDYSSALDLLLGAYLEGFEPMEKAIGARNPGFVKEVEEQFAHIRKLARDRAPATEFAVAIEQLKSKIEEARPHLQPEGMSSSVAFVSSFMIIMREGFEAVLLVVAILAFLRRADKKAAAIYVHYGWMAALLSGVGLWVLAQSIVSISSASREVIEGVTNLLAAVVLFSVSYWLLTKIEVKHWTQYIEKRVKVALTAGSILGLSSVSFLAVFREVFETVLFYQALVLQAQGVVVYVVFGLLAGTIGLMILTLAIFQLGLRIPFNYFFGVTSAFLYLMAIVLAGHGVAELQEAGVISITPIDLIRAPWIGLYPTAETVFAQVLLVAAAIFAAMWAFLLQPSIVQSRVQGRVRAIRKEVHGIVRAVDHLMVHADEISAIEQGAKTSDEVRRIRRHLDELHAEIKRIAEQTSELSGDLMEDFQKVYRNIDTLIPPEEHK